MMAAAKLFETDQGWSGLVLRVTLAVAMFPHRAQKLFGWFGGPGLGATIEYNLIAIGISVALFIGGAGRWSVDRVIANSLRR